MKINTIAEYQEAAKEKLPKSSYDYISGAAFDEVSAKLNVSCFDNIFIQPRVLRKISKHSLSAPLMISPTAFHNLSHEKGEIATASAAKELNIPMIVSVMSSFSLEDIASESNHQQLWLQMYLFKDKALSKSLIDRAALAGFKSIMLSVGMPCHSKRYRDIKNNFKFDDDLRPANFEHMTFNNLMSFNQKYLTKDLDWQDIAWLKANSKLPIYIKGILHPEDAEIACNMGIEGIVVSNHGGRQLDGAIPSILALSSIAKTVNNKIKILFDSGIRRGSDIFKAYALGADKVMVGRPVLWALAVNGQYSVESMLRTLMEDFIITSKLSGCATMEDIRNIGKSFITYYHEK